MKLNRPSSARSDGISQLVLAATQWEQASSRPEASYAETQLAGLIDAQLASGKDTSLLAALDDLWHDHPKAYELLADLIEDRIQTQQVEGEPVAVLVLIPVLTWSRNALPSGKTDAKLVEELKSCLQLHCLAPSVSLCLGHTLYTPDSLPEGFAHTAKWARSYFDAARLGKDVPHGKRNPPEDEAYFLADCRFWAGIVRAPAGAPLFQWQHTAKLSATQATSIKQNWVVQAALAMQPMFIGCGYEVLPPAGYFSACRASESQIRGFSLKASAHMIMSSLDLTPEDLRVVVGACWGTEFEEYRVSLLVRDNDTVLQGVCWPLLARTGGDAESPDQMLADIMQVLNELGIQRVRVLEPQLAMEFCEDCGTPLFPDPAAEMVHTGSPDEDDVDTPSLVIH